MAILPLAPPGAHPPLPVADDVARALDARGHRTIDGPTTLSRVAASELDVGPAWAAKTTEDLNDAGAALARLDRAAAAAAADRAAREISLRGGGEGGAELLAKWALLESRLAAASGHGKAARAWIRAAAGFSPRGELDAENHPEGERAEFAREQSVALAAAPGRITVESTPLGADVWIDGTERCSTPCTERVVPGRHFVRVTSSAHGPSAFEITVGAGGQKARRITLPPLYVGPSPEEISLRFDRDPTRADAMNALRPMTSFLEADRVVAIRTESDHTYRVLISPPVDGHPAGGFAAAPSEIGPRLARELGASRPEGAATDEKRPFYGQPAFLVGAGVVLVGAVVAGILLASSSSQKDGGGTLTVMSP